MSLIQLRGDPIKDPEFIRGCNLWDRAITTDVCASPLYVAHAIGYLLIPTAQIFSDCQG